MVIETKLKVNLNVSEWILKYDWMATEMKLNVNECNRMISEIGLTGYRN